MRDAVSAVAMAMTVVYTAAAVQSVCSAYSKGINKLNHWEPVLEDSIDLIAKLPGIASLIFRNTYKNGDVVVSDSNLDWAFPT